MGSVAAVPINVSSPHGHVRCSSRPVPRRDGLFLLHAFRRVRSRTGVVQPRDDGGMTIFCQRRVCCRMLVPGGNLSDNGREARRKLLLPSSETLLHAWHRSGQYVCEPRHSLIHIGGAQSCRRDDRLVRPCSINANSCPAMCLLKQDFIFSRRSLKPDSESAGEINLPCFQSLTSFIGPLGRVWHTPCICSCERKQIVLFPT